VGKNPDCGNRGNAADRVNPSKGLTFDLKNSTVTRGVWDEDNNLVEMTYCAVTGDVLKKNVIKPGR
jgi:hypothetical protein